MVGAGVILIVTNWLSIRQSRIWKHPLRQIMPHYLFSVAYSFKTKVLINLAR